jgi:hypothetical protein
MDVNREHEAALERSLVNRDVAVPVRVNGWPDEPLEWNRGGHAECDRWGRLTIARKGPRRNALGSLGADVFWIAA